jgi:hypothetical protein
MSFWRPRNRLDTHEVSGRRPIVLSWSGGVLAAVGLSRAPRLPVPREGKQRRQGRE